MAIKLSFLKSACTSTPSPGSGLCAMWVRQVFLKASGKNHYGNAEDHINECATLPLSSIKAGMIVCTDDSPTSKYGHIGIYLGNNTVMDNVGIIRTTTLDYWKSYYSKVTPVKCGWFANIQVTDDSTTSDKLTVDGYWGYNTCIALQKYFGTMKDGMVSHQWSKDKNRHKGCKCFEHDSTGKGSQLIKAIQKKLGVTQDGLCGKDTINALEKHYGITPDGVLDAPSTTIKAMQKALNEGKF